MVGIQRGDDLYAILEIFISMEVAFTALYMINVAIYLHCTKFKFFQDQNNADVSILYYLDF